MKVLDDALQKQPNEPTLLNQYARLMMLSTNFQGAIPYLDRALEQNQKDLFALLNRAIANLKIEQLDAAQRDYEALEAMLPNVSPVCYGLHEIHWRKKHRKLAIKYAEQFLKAAPPGSPEAQELQGRLAKLESGSF
jgi:tetratricopeptide (TPR) repeat protein